MIDPKAFAERLARVGVTFFTGVPDSLLKNFCNYVSSHHIPTEHITAANEGGAIAVAAGYYLGTGQIPLVYFQNSGLGNSINPLVSLCHQSVYQIPMLLLIGWRGEPGIEDEPQHMTQGAITEGLLLQMGISSFVIGSDDNLDIVEIVASEIRGKKAPVALLVKKGTFKQFHSPTPEKIVYRHTRERFIQKLLGILGAADRVVATTGMCSRELYEARIARGEDLSKDFLSVGSMGHASSIAFGLALASPQHRIICLDGDGALLMHMGALPVIGQTKPHNLVHLLINNGVHDSVGGQPTCALEADLCGVARASGYANVFMVEDLDTFSKCFSSLDDTCGPSFIEIRVRPGARVDLGRPESLPIKNKERFMQFLVS